MTVTLLAASILALLYISLTVNVVRWRRATKTSLGDGGSTGLGRAIRGHGNFIEYVPITLILIGLLEAKGAHPWLVLALGIMLVLGRTLHAFGLAFVPEAKSDVTSFRFFGTLITLISLLTAAIAGVVTVFSLG